MSTFRRRRPVYIAVHERPWPSLGPFALVAGLALLVGFATGGPASAPPDDRHPATDRRDAVVRPASGVAVRLEPGDDSAELLHLAAGARVERLCRVPATPQDGTAMWDRVRVGYVVGYIRDADLAFAAGGAPEPAPACP